MRLEVITQKTRDHYLMEGIQRSMIPELNVYNQAHLELERPLVRASRIHKKTNNEIGVTFNLEGELRGQVVCLVDLYEKRIPGQNASQFHSLFIESMNILVGRLLTNLEEETGIMSVISGPKLIARSETFEKNANDSSLKMSLGYKLLTHLESYDCRIYILASHASPKEV